MCNIELLKGKKPLKVGALPRTELNIFIFRRNIPQLAARVRCRRFTLKAYLKTRMTSITHGSERFHCQS